MDDSTLDIPNSLAREDGVLPVAGYSALDDFEHSLTVLLRNWEEKMDTLSTDANEPGCHAASRENEFCGENLYEVLGFCKRHVFRLMKTQSLNLLQILNACVTYLLNTEPNKDAEFLHAIAHQVSPRDGRIVDNVENAPLRLATVEYHFNTARFALEDGEAATAATELEIALNRQTELLEQFDIRGRCGDDADPVLADGWVIAALAAMEAGQHDRAMAHLHRALELWKWWSRSRPEAISLLSAVVETWRALCCWRNGSMDDAWGHLESAKMFFEMTPRSKNRMEYADYAHVRGLVYEANGRFVEANDAFKTALRVSERHLPRHYKTAHRMHRIANILFRQAHYDEALQWLGRTVHIFNHSLGGTARSIRSQQLSADVFEVAGEIRNALRVRAEVEQISEFVRRQNYGGGCWLAV